MTKRVLRAVTLGLILIVAIPLSFTGTTTTHAEPAGPPERFQRVGPLPEGVTIRIPPLELAAMTDDRPRFVFLQLKGEPLARLYAAQREAGAGLMGAELQRSHVQRLELAQQPVVAGATALGVPVISTYQKVLNGVQVKARPSQFEALLALPGVESIHPVTIVELLLGDSVPHIGAQRVIDELGINGTGINIAIIDTGIDYIHTDFGGSGAEGAYEANDITIITDTYDGAALFPTVKVVGGWDFAGTLFNPSCSEQEEAAGICSSTPQPDPDPFDQNGHGTHVAGIAAGIGTAQVAHGVAPGARLWALKVFGANGGTTLLADAIEWAVDPNNDGDLSDALDVLNLSVGAPLSGLKTQRDAVQAMAIQNAVAAGMVVVAAAGNESDVPLIAGTPGSIPAAISVANSFPPGESEFAMEITAPPSVAGKYPAREGAEGFTPRLADVGPTQGELVYVGRGCPAGSGDPPLEQEDPYQGDPKGKLALIDRGVCTFSSKISRAAEAGAMGIVMADNREGPLVIMAGSGELMSIPGVFVSLASGNAIKAGYAQGTVMARLGADIVITHPELTDKIATGSSRGPAWRRAIASVAADSPPTVFKPDITAPGVNIASALAGSGNQSVTISGTSMSTPHVAGVAALIKQAHPTWTPQQIKAAILTTARPKIYLDGHPDFGGGGTVAPATRMGAGLVDAWAAISTNVIVLGDPDTPVVDFGFQAVSEPTSLTRELTIQNNGKTNVTYNAAFEFQDADDADRGVTISLSQDTVTVPANGSATIQVTAAIDPTGLKGWPLSNSSTGDGDDLSDIEYAGWLTFTPPGSAPSQGAGPLSVPVYLLPRKSANIVVGTTAVPLEEFGATNGASFQLTNISAVPGTAEVYTLAGRDPNEDTSSDDVDVQAVGIRNTYVEGLGHVLEFAFATYAPRIHPIQFTAQVSIDVDQDRTADYVLRDVDFGLLTTGQLSGIDVSVLIDLAAGTLSPNVFFAQTDLFTSNMVLPVLAEDMGLSSDKLTFDYWVAVFDGAGNLMDVLPEGAFATPARYTFDGVNPLYVVDQASVDVVGSQTINFHAEPLGAFARPSADGFLILYDSSPTNMAAGIVEVDFEYEALEIAIEAERAATGFVNSKDPASASLGGSRLWTGLTTERVRWYGITQFDLSAEVPSNARIVAAELDLTGQELKYLNNNADGTWTVNLLDESVDSTWPDVSYFVIHRAGVDATLERELRDDDLGAGVVNVFHFNEGQISLLEQRVATSGRVSFRTNMVLDRPARFFDIRHLFAWDGGGGTQIPGEQPPVLRIKYIAAK